MPDQDPVVSESPSTFKASLIRVFAVQIIALALLAVLQCSYPVF